MSIDYTEFHSSCCKYNFNNLLIISIISDLTKEHMIKNILLKYHGLQH